MRRLASGSVVKGKKAAVIVEDFQERRLLGLVREPAMWRSVVLPELADLLDLPAAHRLGAFFVTGVRGQFLKEGPADGGAIKLERMAAMHFRSSKTVGGRRVGTQQLA